MTRRIKVRHADDGIVCSFLLLADEYDLQMYGVGDVYTINTKGDGDTTSIPCFLEEANTLFEFRLLP